MRPVHRSDRIESLTFSQLESASELTMLSTRQATVNDLTLLADVFLRAMRVHITAARGFWDEDKERSDFEQQLQLNQTRIIVRDGVDVGFLMTVPRGPDTEIHTICIAPGHQRQGIGAAITGHLIEEARAQMRGVVLSVLKANEEARSFYERLGFGVTEESTYHYRMRLISRARC